MFKFGIILLVGQFFVVVYGITKKDAQVMFIDLSKDCKNSTGASDDDVQTMVDGKFPDTPKGKCLLACMQEQFRIQEDGKFCKEGFLDMAAMGANNNEDALNAAKEIADECEKVVDPDRCELAVKIGECMAEGAKTRGLKPPFDEEEE